jgi:hypothetical protein
MTDERTQFRAHLRVLVHRSPGTVRARVWVRTPAAGPRSAAGGQESVSFSVRLWRALVWLADRCDLIREIRREPAFGVLHRDALAAGVGLDLVLPDATHHEVA